MRQLLILLTALLPLAAGCTGTGDPDLGRLHTAQRDYWEVRRFQEQLDIYPSLGMAEECRDRYLAIAERLPLAEVPDPLVDGEASTVKLARVGAMSALGAAALHRELGEREQAIALLRGVLRDDLPLGALVERKLRGTLASNLRDIGRLDEALAVHRSLLAPIRPDLEAEIDAAFPDPELLALPGNMVGLAESLGDSLALAELGDFLAEFFGRVKRMYPGSDAEYDGLLVWSDMAMHLNRWDAAERALLDLAEGFPEREPWRADLRRARLLSERLDRHEESEAILTHWAETGRGDAAVAAGKERIRFLLQRDRIDEVDSELMRLKRVARRREDRAELLYLWGIYELARGSWDQARLRWGEAAADAPYTPFGMESQLAIALLWEERDQPRFVARALDRLFRACRRNSRHYAGSALASRSLALETRADSLLGTLPASEEAVQDLLDRRHPTREGS
jgi:hypothetical protein